MPDTTATPSSRSPHGSEPSSLNLEEIEARAAAAPDGGWVPCGDSMWIPWSADDDRDPESPHDRGRYIAVRDGDWHGTGEPPAALWDFLAHSHGDVLALTAEVRRLRAELGTVGQCAAYLDETLAREAGLL